MHNMQSQTVTISIESNYRTKSLGDLWFSWRKKFYWLLTCTLADSFFLRDYAVLYCLLHIKGTLKRGDEDVRQREEPEIASHIEPWCGRQKVRGWLFHI